MISKTTNGTTQINVQSDMDSHKAPFIRIAYNTGDFNFIIHECTGTFSHNERYKENCFAVGDNPYFLRLTGCLGLFLAVSGCFNGPHIYTVMVLYFTA